MDPSLADPGALAQRAPARQRSGIGKTEPVSESLPRQSARTRRFRLGLPRAVTVAPDGSRVVLIRSNAGDDPVGRLVVVDVATAAERVVADPTLLLADGPEVLSEVERARRERMRETTSGIVGYTVDEPVRRAAFALSGELWVVDLIEGSAPRRLDVPGPVVDPRVCPDGTAVAYVVAGAVRVVGWAGEGDRALAEPESDTVTYGLADFVAAEELARSRGLWWLPDSSALLVERTDVAEVAQWWIADPLHPAARPVPHRYPAAGTANPAVSVHLLGLDGTRANLEWDDDAFCYLADVSVNRNGDPLLVLLDRPQRRRLVLAVDQRTARSRTVLADTDPAWVDSEPGQVRWAPGGRLVVRFADPGTDTYRVSVDGIATSPAGVQVAAVLDVADDGALLMVQDDPSHCATAVLGWDGTLRPVPGPGTWRTGVRGGGTVVVHRTDWSTPGITVDVQRTDGTSFELRSYAETPVVAAGFGSGAAVLTVGERRLRTVVLFPTGHRPGSGRLPVVMAPYGGPGHAVVVAAGGAYVEDQWLADQGFAVVKADGRGTPGRGPAWERAIAGDLASAALADQVDALAGVVAAYPDDVDPGRVAIHGWSFGGYLAALAVLRRPDVFHAAVAGAPVTEWRWYDTAYTERYLGHPDHDPAAYDASSLLPLAPGLRRPLLLMHGMTDDNVVVAHTLALSAALTEAGRPHQVLPLSGVTHMTPQPQVAENKLLLELDFLRAALAAPTPLS
jgi:dipeptidyl-peptidase-4